MEAMEYPNSAGPYLTAAPFQKPLAQRRSFSDFKHNVNLWDGEEFWSWRSVSVRLCPRICTMWPIQ